MATDYELLTAAAYAVNNGSWHPLTHDTPNGRSWNPLDFMGDALRLAVELRLVVDVGCEAVHVFKDGQGVTVPLGLDPGKAARRAIVLAAAAWQRLPARSRPSKWARPPTCCCAARRC